VAQNIIGCRGMEMQIGERKARQIAYARKWPLAARTEFNRKLKPLPAIQLVRGHGRDVGFGFDNVDMKVSCILRF